MDQPRVAASWGQGKIDTQATTRKSNTDLAKKTKETRWVECHECRKSGKHGGYGLCSSCYDKWRRTQTRGHCDTCDHPQQRALYRVTSPTRCWSCYQKEWNKSRKEIDPEGAKAWNRLRWSREKAKLDPEVLRERRRKRYIPRSQMTPEQLAAARAYDLAKFHRRKNKDIPLPPRPKFDKQETVAPTIVPRPHTALRGLTRGKIDAPVMEGSFNDAIAARKRDPRQGKKYRKRYAA